MVILEGRALLLEHALDAGDPATLAFAGVLGRALDRGDATTSALPLAHGLDASATRAVLDRWFPGAAAALAASHGEPGAAATPATDDAARADEFDDLLALLIEHAAPDAGSPAEIGLVARLVAGACLGEQHLWQDLGLPSRRELSALLGHWFAPLARRNTHDMKWKKFFYKQLCEREGLSLCKAPSCGVCTDYARCFGPET